MFLLAGMIQNSRPSLLRVALSRAVDSDPDELLDARWPALEPEAEALLDEAEALDAADRRLLVDLVRAFARRRSSP